MCVETKLLQRALQKVRGTLLRGPPAARAALRSTEPRSHTARALLQKERPARAKGRLRFAHVRHVAFPRGPPPQYYRRELVLKFEVQMGFAAVTSL